MVRDIDDKAPPADAGLTARSGFTLIELLIALVLLDVGLLALVGLGAALTRLANADRAGFLATTLASARVERLASTPCGGPLTVIQHLGAAVIESYSDTPRPNGTR